MVREYGDDRRQPPLQGIESKPPLADVPAEAAPAGLLDARSEAEKTRPIVPATLRMPHTLVREKDSQPSVDTRVPGAHTCEPLCVIDGINPPLWGKISLSFRAIAVIF